jgi:hypothetical protein
MISMARISGAPALDPPGTMEADKALGGGAGDGAPRPATEIGGEGCGVMPPELGADVKRAQADRGVGQEARGEISLINVTGGDIGEDAHNLVPMGVASSLAPPGQGRDRCVRAPSRLFQATQGPISPFCCVTLSCWPLRTG